jgi:peptide/nickel transport system substrate-binding protein
MKKLRWQILIVVIALVSIAIVIFGNKPILETISAAPSAGGLYTEALIGSPSRYNPLLDYYNQVDRDVDRLIFGSLVKFDSRGNPVPELAEAIGESVDGEVYNVTLREGVLWHDGEPLTSADVVFTIDLMRDESIPLPEDIRALWNSIEVITFDDYNIQFRLSEPYAPFLDYLSFGILPEHLLEGKTGDAFINSSFNLEPVGSGPYQFDELIVENGKITGVILKAFNDYYEERPFIDQIVFRYYDNTMDALTAYRDGEILGIGSVDEDSLQDVLNEPGLNIYTSQLPQMCILLLNLGNDNVGFFQEADVRKALMYALNRPWMIDQALDGQAIIAKGPIFPGSWAYFDTSERFDYDPKTAEEMLRLAGYVFPAKGGSVREKDGQKLSIDLVHLDDDEHTALAEMIKENWQAIGVEVNLVAASETDLLTKYLEPRSYEAILADWSLARTPDPDPYPFWHQSQITGGQNYSMWNDRRASEYLENARVTTLHSERERLYRNFQVHFDRELPALPLFYPMYTYAVDASVGGISIGPVYDPSDRFDNILNWYMVAQPEIKEEISTESQN